jgi:membrane associated rhomboid family serine protease
MFRNLPPICKGIILALVASAVLSLIVPSLVVSVLPLYPELVLRGIQVWRLISYPFYFAASGRGLLGSLISLAWIGMLVAFFGAELESIVRSKRFGMALGITIVGGGILFTLLSPDGVLAGPSIITMFVLGGFAYMWPKREISIFGLFWGKAWIIALVLFAVSVIPMSGLNLDTSASNLFAPFFGALGAILYFHITYRQYRFGRALLSKFDSVAVRQAKPSYDATDPRSVERHIDAILDKIGKTGMDSLSKEEREFLLKHSK